MVRLWWIRGKSVVLRVVSPASEWLVGSLDWDWVADQVGG